MLNMDSVYREYAEFVHKFLLSICYEEDLAEELTQETFYQAVRSQTGMTDRVRCPHGCVRLRNARGTGN